MADLSTVIQLLFTGNADDASNAIKQIKGDLNSLSSAAQGIAAPFASLANGMIAAEVAAAAFSVAIGVMAVNETIKFKDSLALVGKGLDDSSVTTEEARLAIEKLALQYGINANDVAASMSGFLMAGKDYEQSSKLVVTATQLMISGELSAKVATDAINQSLAGFRVPAAEAAAGAEHVGDVLNKIGDISSGKFEEIVQGFSRISPTARDAGLSMEETAAIIATLVDNVGSGEIAATALKSGLLTLIDPSKEASKELGKLGVSLTGSNGEMVSSKIILETLAGKWSGLTDIQRQHSAAVIFGKEQAGAMSTVLGDWGKVQDYLAQSLDKTTGAIGSMSREVDVKMKLISTSVNIASESWRQFLENLGNRLVGDPAGSMQGVITAVGNLGISLKDVVTTGGLDPLIQLVQSQSGKLSELLNAIAKNLPAAFEGLDWSKLIASLEGLGGEIGVLFGNFFGAIDLTTVEGLHSAIQTIINTFGVLTTTVTGITSTFRPLISAIGEATLRFGQLDSVDSMDFGKFLGSMKLITDAGVGLGLALIAVGQTSLAVGDIIDTALGGLKVVINGLQVGFDGMVLAMTQIWKTALEMSLQIYKLNPFADEAMIADAEAKIAKVGEFADAVSANMKRNLGEMDAASEQAAKGFNSLGDSSTESKDKLQKLEDGLRSIKSPANNAKVEMEQLGKAVPVSQFDGAIGGLRKLEDEAGSIKLGEKMAKQVDLSKKAFDELDQKISKIEWGKGGGLSVKEPLDANIKITQVWNEELGKLVTVYDSASDATVKATGAFKGAAGAGKDVSKSLDELSASGKLSVDQMIKVAESANAFKVKMEEIASNERIKNIEAVVSINTAKLKADADRVKSTFESIDNTVTSTGDLLGNLFGSFANASSSWDKAKIESQIALENKRRQDALDIQKKLAEAEIERVQAQIESLNRGDALIKIEGGDLKPELEAFMWKILSLIRMRANAEFSQYLLGVASP